MKPIRVLFFGTPDLARTSLEALCNSTNISVQAVITQPDRPAGRGHHLQKSPVKEFAESKGIPIFQPASVRRELNDFTTLISPYGPFDIGVVAAFGQILPPEILSLPTYGCVNVHTSLLPRWRGAAPIQRALMEGDSETGVCIMQMEAGLDTGPVFATQSVTIQREDTAKTLHDKLAQAGATLLLTTLEKIIAGTISATPQSEIGISYAKKITGADAPIHWSNPAPKINNQIRGLSPAPGAHTFVQGKKLKIFRSDELTDSAAVEAGSITQIDKHYFDVACSSGQLRIYEVQLEGKRRMDAADFLRGIELRVGEILG